MGYRDFTGAHFNVNFIHPDGQMLFGHLVVDVYFVNIFKI